MRLRPGLCRGPRCGSLALQRSPKPSSWIWRGRGREGKSKGKRGRGGEGRKGRKGKGRSTPEQKFWLRP